MATKKINIKVSESGAKQAAAGLGQVDNSMKKLASSAVKMAAAYFSTQGLINGAKAALNAYGQQELAEKKLETALGKTSSALLAQASALQKISIFGDEATIEAQALLAAFTKEESQIMALTEVTQDLAAAKGMDLKSAADLVAKSFGSSTNALSRYGIEVTASAGSTARLEQITKGISDLYGGQATAAALTFTGKMTQLKNAMGDTAEVVGGLLAPTIGMIAEKMKESQAAIQGFLQGIDFAETLKNVYTNVKAWLELLLATWGAVFDYFPDLAKNAFHNIVNDGPRIFSKFFDWIISQTQILWNPLWISAKIATKKVIQFFVVMGENIANAAIKGVNLAIEAFNFLANSWVGEKIGITPIESKDLINTDDVRAGMQTEIDALVEMLKETKAVKLLFPEDDIQTAQDFTTKLKNIWKTYTSEIVAIKKESDNQIKQSNDSITKNAMANMKKQAIYTINYSQLVASSIETMFDKEMKGGEKVQAFIINLLSLFQGVILASKAVSEALTFTFSGPAGIAAAGAAIVALETAKMAVRNVKFAADGADFVTSGPQLLMVGENPGGRERVQVTPLSSPNRKGPNGGESVVINIHGDFLGTEEQADKLAKIFYERSLMGFNRIAVK